MHMLFVSILATAQTFNNLSSWKSLRPYPIGLKIVYQYDRSRSYPSVRMGCGQSPPVGDDASHLQLPTIVCIVAEAQPNTLTVGDYVQLADTEIDFNATRR